MSGRGASLLLAIALGLAACSDSTPTSSGPVSRFTADTPSPGNDTVALLPGSASGASVVVRVTVTGVNDFFGAGFRIEYDPNALLFAGWDTRSSFLRTGVAASDVLFSEDHTSIGGQVVIVATRLDPTVAPPVDVTTTSTLVTLTFVARKPIAAGAAEGRLDFGDPKQVCDGSVAAPGCNPIAVTWSGGGLSAQ